MTNSEIVKRYISYCFSFAPRMHTPRGDLPLGVFKLDNVKIEPNPNGLNYISFDLIDNHGVLLIHPDSFFGRAFNPFGFDDSRINTVAVKGNICMKTGYIQLVDLFNGRRFYSAIPDNIKTFDKYVEGLEERGLNEKPKGILKIPAHMMMTV